MERGKSTENPDYLNPDAFINHFYEPAVGLLGDLIRGFIFEQEYRLKRERGSPDEHAAALGEFFDKIPGDERYHIELRTEPYLSDSYFKVLERYGLGQVLSHWTWLPPLRTQFKKSNGAFFSAGKQCIIRLVTPLRMGYEETYIRAYPFDRMIDGMMSQQMVEDTVEITLEAISQGISVNVVVNNRAGGNAPIIAQRISKKLLETHC